MNAELLIFSYPVYTFIVPSQLHRFIELMKEAEMELSEKFATQITTSKHFYDITAHNFIMENAQDMHLKFIKGLSADMDDLTTEKGRKDVLSFFKYVEFCTENDIYESFPEKRETAKHVPVNPVDKTETVKDGTVALVADLDPEDKNLKAMIERFTAKLPYKVNLVNIHDFPFKGGCISCFNGLKI